MEETDLILSLREVRIPNLPYFLPTKLLHQELYPEDFYSINWPAQRNNVNKVDKYVPHSAFVDALNAISSFYENCTFPPLRRAGLARAYELIVMEDENTEYQTIAPVSKMFNLIARAHVEGPDSFAYKEHAIKRQDFMWIGAEGMMMAGTNGSQLWDIGFITQALVETGLANEEENKESMIKALEWLDQAQIRTDPKHYREAYRHTSKGAWGFRFVRIISVLFSSLTIHKYSTPEQGYTVSDCTGEGLKATMYLQFDLESVYFRSHFVLLLTCRPP
jgi:lanosterol synthase